MDERLTCGSDALLESWLEFGELLEQRPELRRSLFDPVTELPTVPLLFPRIASLLEDRGEVSLLCIDVIRYTCSRSVGGWRASDRVMREIAEVLDEIAGETLRDTDVIAEMMNSGDAFVVVLSPPRMTQHADVRALTELAERVESKLRQRMAERVDAATMREFGFFAGTATVHMQEGVRLERLVSESLNAALSDARNRSQYDRDRYAERLRAVIEDGLVETVFQPVFDIASDTISGYRAVSRGPVGTEFETICASSLIDSDTSLGEKLDRMRVKRALEVAKSMPDDIVIHVGVPFEALASVRIREMAGAVALSGGLRAGSVVFELPERSVAADLGACRSHLEYLRVLGYQLSIGGSVAGFDSMLGLDDLKPEWLGIDASLVHGCDGDEVRRSLISALVVFARRFGARLVAEGVRTAGEIAVLSELGVGYAHGPHFGPAGTEPVISVKE